MRMPKNKQIRIITLLVVALVATAFFVDRYDGEKAAVPRNDAMQQELERLKEISNREAEELAEARKEVPKRVYEYRKAVHTRTRMLSADAVAAELSALLEQSRREQSGDEQL